MFGERRVVWVNWSYLEIVFGSGFVEMDGRNIHFECCVEMSNTEIKVNFVPFTPQIQLFQYNNFTWLSQDKIEVKSVG